MPLNTFPTTPHAPEYASFSETPSEDAVLISSTASGYPVANKQFTFAPNTFRFTMNLVQQAYKEDIDEFYENNKDVPFYWLNYQNGVTYEVIFSGVPDRSTIGRKDLWQIGLTLIQVAPLL